MKTDIEFENKVVENFQREWANYVLAIGEAYRTNKDYKKLTEELIDKLYALDISAVLFKPTKAKEVQFRKSKDEMISYFSGSNNVCEEDKGFAIEPWKTIRFENHQIVNLGTIILAMGNYYFKKQDNSEIKVEFTFGFIYSKSGKLKINLHHSSIPYTE